MSLKNIIRNIHDSDLLKTRITDIDGLSPNARAKLAELRCKYVYQCLGLSRSTNIYFRVVHGRKFGDIPIGAIRSVAEFLNGECYEIGQWAAYQAALFAYDIEKEMDQNLDGDFLAAALEKSYLSANILRNYSGQHPAGREVFREGLLRHFDL